MSYLRPFGILLFCVLLLHEFTYGDQITVGGHRHSDVYIFDAGHVWQVFSMDEHLLMTVSKKRADVKDVSIDRDDPARAEFFERVSEVHDTKRSGSTKPGQEPLPGKTEAKATKSLSLRGDPEIAAATRAATAAANARYREKREADARIEAQIQREEEAAQHRRNLEMQQLHNDARAIEAEEMKAYAVMENANAQHNNAAAIRNYSAAERESADAMRDLSRELNRIRN